ncbi:MAG: hypothetical protein R3C11_27835 [Planctomycetaceae bacterium]
MNCKSDFGKLAVEVLDEQRQAIPGFTLEDCNTISADSLEQPVTWKEHQDLTALAGKEIRLRFHLINTRLYSYRIV